MCGCVRRLSSLRVIFDTCEFVCADVETFQCVCFQVGRKPFLCDNFYIIFPKSQKDPEYLTLIFMEDGKCYRLVLRPQNI